MRSANADKVLAAVLEAWDGDDEREFEAALEAARVFLGRGTEGSFIDARRALERILGFIR